MGRGFDWRPLRYLVQLPLARLQLAARTLGESSRKPQLGPGRPGLWRQ